MDLREVYWISASHRGPCEEYDLLGYNAVWFGRSPPTFRRNLSLPSSGFTSKPNKKPARSSDTFLRNVSGLVPK
jgi:hypothetical protein